MPPILDQSPDGDKILVDREKFRKVLSLLLASMDELSNARHREVFLDCLDIFLTEPPCVEDGQPFLDDAGCFQASLLLDAYYEYVLASLASLSSNLQQAADLIRGQL